MRSCCTNFRQRELRANSPRYHVQCCIIFPNFDTVPAWRCAWHREWNRHLLSNKGRPLPPRHLMYIPLSVACTTRPPIDKPILNPDPPLPSCQDSIVNGSAPLNSRCFNPPTPHHVIFPHDTRDTSLLHPALTLLTLSENPYLDFSEDYPDPTSQNGQKLKCCTHKHLNVSSKSSTLHPRQKVKDSYWCRVQYCNRDNFSIRSRIINICIHTYTHVTKVASNETRLKHRRGTSLIPGAVPVDGRNRSIYIAPTEELKIHRK